MEKAIPRLVIAGTHSGCGKTTVSCAILQALINRGLKVGAFKCGPDYIDPMFHSQIIGAKSGNLDLFLFSENTAKYLLAQNGRDRDISIIEGVMGFYDGMGITDTKASTYDLAKVTESPTILVVDAKGASLSILATIQGFLEFRSDNLIAGVILNRCSEATYTLLAAEITEYFSGRIIPLGFFPPVPNGSLESRHLGLITAAEVEDLQEKLQVLATQAEKTIDIDGLISISKSATSVSFSEIELPRNRESVCIAVASDRAFCFYYPDSLRMLEELGAELISFSPLVDTELPENIHGMYLGGGYPELYARQLSENTFMLAAIKKALQNGLPCIAEGGGFMYLTEAIAEYPMVNYLPGKSFDTGRLVRFGYAILKAKEDNMLCRAGEEIASREYHKWDAEDPGDFFTASKASGRSWDCVHAGARLYAGFPHLHFYANPAFAVNFYNTCLEVKKQNDKKY